MTQSNKTRGDFVDDETIQSFVGDVEPGDHVRLAVILWTVGLSIAFIIAASIWWSIAH